MKIITHRIIKPWYNLDFFFKMTPMYLELKRCSKIVFGFIGDTIITKKKELNDKLVQRDAISDVDASFKTPQRFIDQLLKLEGNYFNDWDMLSEATTIVGAVSTNI